MCKAIGVIYRRRCLGCNKVQEKVILEDHIEVIPEDAEFFTPGLYNGHEVDFVVDRNFVCDEKCAMVYHGRSRVSTEIN
jgi:hypothetical protein